MTHSFPTRRSSDLASRSRRRSSPWPRTRPRPPTIDPSPCVLRPGAFGRAAPALWRSEEHTSELQSLMRISYAVFCLKKKKQNVNTYPHDTITNQRYRRSMNTDTKRLNKDRE